MEVVLPWMVLIDLIEPCYPRTDSKDGRSPYLLGTVLRIHPMQQLYDLSDQGAEDVLIEVPTICRFIWDPVADEIDRCETAFLAYRYLLEKCHLGKHIYWSAGYVIYATHNIRLQANGMA